MIKILEYNLRGKLPDPFVFDSGEHLSSRLDWQRRREEIYKSAVELQYGPIPPAPERVSAEPIYINKANPSTYRVRAEANGRELSFDLIVFKAPGKEKHPTVISGDACFKYPFNPEYVNTYLENGINLVFFNRTDIFPDVARYNTESLDKSSAEYRMVCDTVEAFERGEGRGPLCRMFPDKKIRSIAAWAWGYSRVVDALEQLGFADMDAIVFTGHSRGGKTAMLAGALDERAAIVNPNGACAGGCSCYRLVIKAEKEDGVSVATSEPLSNIFRQFPTWLGEGMRDYIDREEELPFDSHYLKAMVAPRILFVSEAASDIMANPVGSWQTTMGAYEVYKFLGVEDRLLWYFRDGDHAQTTEDVEQLINVIKNYKYGEPLNDKFFKTKFEPVPLAFDWRAEDVIDAAAEKILSEYREAFEELAK